MAEIMLPRALGVAEINYYIKEYLAEDSLLANVAVEGEISGFKEHGSGHIYFTLREADCGLKAVMFRRAAAALNWRPRDGDMTVAVGSVALYERDGVCQLYVQALFPAGAGAEAGAREKLKRRLEAEGLFAPERKQQLPDYAFDIGVVTAEGSAAWADIRRIAYSRMPGVKLTLYPALVQGAQAAASLVAALARADAGGHQALICGRGGGAEEDLAAFDSEQVVRAIAATRTPLISAVGHESDITLADLAADLRAATPSHATALIVPEAAELANMLARQEERLHAATQAAYERKSAALSALEQTPCLLYPLSLLLPARYATDAAGQRLYLALEQGLRRKEEHLDTAAAALEYLSPLATLRRGYAVVSDISGKPLPDAGAVRPGERLLIRLASGRIIALAETAETCMEEDDNG